MTTKTRAMLFCALCTWFGSGACGERVILGAYVDPDAPNSPGLDAAIPPKFAPPVRDAGELDGDDGSFVITELDASLDAR